MKLTKKRIISAIAAVAVLTSMFFVYTTSSKSRIVALGYDVVQAEKYIEKYGILTAAGKVEDELESNIEKQEKLLKDEVGISPTLIENYDTLSRVKYNERLQTFVESSKKLYSDEITKIEDALKVYPLENEFNNKGKSLYQQYTERVKLLSKFEGEYLPKVEEQKQILRNYGMRDTEINSLISGNIVSDLETLLAKVDYYNQFSALLSTSGNTYAPGAMDLLAILNSHRTSRGLQPFAYNSAQQGCVDIEANSYANNKNPHNWLCKTLVSEGASLASVSSNYVSIAGNFLTTNPSHEADVINPNFSSAACSAVQKGNMVYMICGYFS